MKQKIGNTLLDLELVLDDMADQGLQMGDIIYLVYAYLKIHRPDCIEEYEDGTHPVLNYGPQE